MIFPKSKNNLQNALPSAITNLLNSLNGSKFEAYVVGGCVRDLLLDRPPKDWDVATNATPEDIQRVFSDTYYNNEYGTVVVKLDGELIEVTPYRKDIGYSDSRHPDHVEFGKTLEEDLARRDFTMNAIAFGKKSSRARFALVDPFGGQKDIERRVLRTVGDANERFAEDALRLLRGLRFTAELGFRIDEATWAALRQRAHELARVSGERVRDELIKMLAGDFPIVGLWLMFESGMMKVLLPELVAGACVGQNKHHIYSVLFHNLMAAQHCTSDDPLVRLASLFHDIGKVETKQGDGPDSTFYAHDYVGARITRRIMRRLHFSNSDIDRVSHLVRHHMFYYSIGEVSDAGVRRLLKRIGPDNIDDFIAVRIGDRMGSGTQVEMPHKLHMLLEHMRNVQRDPISVRSLAIDGNDLMKELGVKPGPVIGAIQETLLEEVLDDPSLNMREVLLEKAKAYDQEKVLAEYRERRRKNQEESHRLFDEGVDAETLSKPTY